MRLVGPTFLRAFPGGVLNVHPALLPSFPGLHGHRQALEHGVKMTGCTVHLVDEGTDTGPIVAQAAVPVLDGDTEESLQKRIQEQEHRLFPLALGLLASGRLRVEGRRVRVEGSGPEPVGVALVNPGRL
jgi:phosphoribosylglycinamide formyltransferase-1